ncbi:phosphotransferase family protein [Nocardioides pantholopis]|uniref:phosphotransferase family protein n=1 Tax=Nocardioides pantholopis TaxID=2483798 RepID=UPI0013E2E31B|nr:phosphotransferase [Nocardioides pantholopis]
MSPGGLGGLDHEVTPGRVDTVVRRRRPGADGLDVASEAALLALVRTTTPVPVPWVLGTWPAQGVMELERVGGTPLLDLLPALPPPAAVRLGSELGGHIATLALAPRARVERLVPVDLPLVGDLLAEAADAWVQARHLVSPGRRRSVEAFLRSIPDLHPADPVLTHQDLGAEHVLVDDVGITGIIDWSDAALGDPAVDLGLVLRDLGPAAGERAMVRFTGSGLGDPGLRERALVHARLRALEDLAYGLGAGRSTYRDNALRALARLFPGDG